MSARSQRRVGLRHVSSVALTLTALCVAAAVGMQWMTGLWFPPDDSISQYANTEAWWLLTIALVTLGLAVGCLSWMSAQYDDEELPTILLGMSALGLVLSAVVPATEGGHDPENLQSQIHQTGGVLGMLSLAVAAVLLAVPRRSTPLGKACLTTAFITLGSLLLLGMSAFHIDPLGLGRHEGWALYQTIAAVCEAVFVLILALLLRPSAGRRPAATTR